MKKYIAYLTRGEANFPNLSPKIDLRVKYGEILKQSFTEKKVN